MHVAFHECNKTDEKPNKVEHRIVAKLVLGCSTLACNVLLLFCRFYGKKHDNAKE